MSEKDEIIKEKLDFNGLFKFADLYEQAHTWFNEESYGVVEDKYAEKISGNTKEIDVEWKCTKQISDYFKIDTKVKFEVKNLVDVEVEIDGKKKKMQQGKVKIEIKGNLIKDVQSNWDTSPYWRFMRDVYNKYIVPQRVDSMEDKVKSDVKEFKDEMKEYLDLTGKR
jgi:hypothetical protein